MSQWWRAAGFLAVILAPVITVAFIVMVSRLG